MRLNHYLQIAIVILCLSGLSLHLMYKSDNYIQIPVTVVDKFITQYDGTTDWKIEYQVQDTSDTFIKYVRSSAYDKYQIGEQYLMSLNKADRGDPTAYSDIEFILAWVSLVFSAFATLVIVLFRWTESW
jgi:hypothetical protein